MRAKIVPLVFAVLAVVALAALSAEPERRIRVVDGDTVALGATPVRLVGLNAPEIGRARCAAERALGDAAKRRLEEIVAAGARLSLVACACPPGTEGTAACNFGRACGVLALDGRDAAAMLIGEGLAAPFRCGPTRCPKRPSPWCG